MGRPSVMGVVSSLVATQRVLSYKLEHEHAGVCLTALFMHRQPAVGPTLPHPPLHGSRHMTVQTARRDSTAPQDPIPVAPWRVVGMLTALVPPPSTAPRVQRDPPSWASGTTLWAAVTRYCFGYSVVHEAHPLPLPTATTTLMRYRKGGGVFCDCGAHYVSCLRILFCLVHCARVL